MTQYLVRWVEDNSLIGENGSFTNWDEGEPGGGDLENYKCMQINAHRNSQKWFDTACNDEGTTICSMPDTEKQTTEQPATEEPAITTTTENTSASTSTTKSNNSIKALIMSSCLVLVSGFVRSKY